MDKIRIDNNNRLHYRSRSFTGIIKAVYAKDNRRPNEEQLFKRD